MIALPRRNGARARARSHRPCQSRRHREGHQPFRPRLGAPHPDHEDRGLKQALDKYGFDAAFGGARRDEEKSRAKERIFSFRDATPSLGPEEPAPGTVEPLQRPQEQGRNRSACFPLSNWTELDIWQYIHLENIPIVPLYFAAARPIVWRDGQMIMVDDERMPLNPGEKPRNAQDPLPHPRLLSPDRRHRIQRHRRFSTSSRKCWSPPPPSARAASSTRTRPPPWRRRSRKDISDVARSIEFDGGDVEAYLRAQESKDLLRFITCGSVDDGKSTLIGRLLYEAKMLFEDQLLALEADSKKIGHAGRQARFRASGRRPRRRTRAGHHHRCRLSRLHHRQAQIHRRRYAGP